jgi:hypothetical protein
MNDEEIFRKFFGSANPHHNLNDPFMFHNDFQRMFNEMDQMMSRFHFGHFNMIDGKHCHSFV